MQTFLKKFPREDTPEYTEGIISNILIDVKNKKKVQVKKSMDLVALLEIVRMGKA